MVEHNTMTLGEMKDKTLLLIAPSKKRLPVGYTPGQSNLGGFVGSL